MATAVTTAVLASRPNGAHGGDLEAITVNPGHTPSMSERVKRDEALGPQENNSEGLSCPSPCREPPRPQEAD